MNNWECECCGCISFYYQVTEYNVEDDKKCFHCGSYDIVEIVWERPKQTWI